MDVVLRVQQVGIHRILDAGSTWIGMRSGLQFIEHGLFRLLLVGRVHVQIARLVPLDARMRSWK